MKSERILRGDLGKEDRNLTVSIRAEGLDSFSRMLDKTTETFLCRGLKRKTVTRLVKCLQARLLQLHQLQFLFGSNDRNLRNKEKKKKRKVLAR